MNLDADQALRNDAADTEKSWRSNVSVSRESDSEDFYFSCFAAEKLVPNGLSTPPTDSFRKENAPSCHNEGHSMMTKSLRSTQLIDRKAVSERNDKLRMYSPDLSKCEQDCGNLKLKSLKPLPMSLQILLSNTNRDYY
jgi:hypothetical protein